MTPNDDPSKPVPPVENPAAPDEPLEPPLEGTLTAEDIAELEASEFTLSDFIRELESGME